MKLKVQNSNKLSTKLISFLPILKSTIDEIDDIAKEVALENPLIEVKNKKFITASNYIQNSNTDVIEGTTLDNESLFESMIKQVENSVHLFPTEMSRTVAKEIVYEIDNEGFFTGSEEEISQKLEVPIEKVEKIRKRFAHLLPTGVGALSREESFLFQLDALEGIDEELYALTKEMCEHFDYIENYKDEPRFREALGVIKRFKLSPALEFFENDYVIPDIFVLREGNNLEIKLNDDYYPTIEIKESSENDTFVKEKLQEAKSLIDAIEMRKATLYKIGLMIVEIQYDYFLGGEMKPMKLADLAEELDYAQSTVSRAVSNKYILCDQGLIPIKSFFSTAIDEDVSSNQIKALIKKIIESESKEKPLNDEKITEKIKEDLGISIVRRTVSKYREALGIATSRQRKRMYKLI